MHHCAKSILDETGRQLRAAEFKDSTSVEAYVRLQNARWHVAAITGIGAWICHVIRAAIARRESQPAPLRLLGD